MYQSLLIYIIVILVYATHIPAATATFSPGKTILLQAGLYAFFYLLTRIRLGGIVKSYRQQRFSAEQLAEAYERSLTMLTVLAVGAYIMTVYLVNIKPLIAALPLVRHSEMLNNLIAFGIFLAYQLIIWQEAHRHFSPYFTFTSDRWVYCRQKLFFALGIIAPWLLITGLGDLGRWLAPDSFSRIQHQPAVYIGLFALFLLILALTAPLLMVKFWGCRPLPPSPLRRRLEELCRREKVSYRQIMLWPSFEGKMATAAVIGPFAVTRYLLITPALIELLTTDEIEAVMAHEIGHVRHHHLLVYFIFFLSLFLLNYAFFTLIVSWLLTTDLLHYLLLQAPHHQATIVSLAATIPLLLIYILYFRFIFGYFLRNFERQADLHVFQALGTATPLITAFHKLAWLTGDSGQRANWHHYNIPQRIAYLEKCQQNPALITAHRQKLRRGLGIFLLAVAILGTVGYRLNASGLQQSLDNRFLIKLLEDYRRTHGSDHRVYLTLGSLYYEVGDYRQAAALYEAALQTERQPQPELLNNYAWLLLTADDPRVKDIARGFDLARRAATLKPVPHILDTLAEAYWRRGMPCMALDIERRLLAGNPGNRRLYEQQVEKFARDCRR